VHLKACAAGVDLSVHRGFQAKLAADS